MDEVTSVRIVEMPDNSTQQIRNQVVAASIGTLISVVGAVATDALVARMRRRRDEKKAKAETKTEN